MKTRARSRIQIGIGIRVRIRVRVRTRVGIRVGILRGARGVRFVHALRRPWLGEEQSPAVERGRGTMRAW